MCRPGRLPLPRTLTFRRRTMSLMRTSRRYETPPSPTATGTSPCRCGSVEPQRCPASGLSLVHALSMCHSSGVGVLTVKTAFSCSLHLSVVPYKQTIMHAPDLLLAWPTHAAVTSSMGAGVCGAVPAAATSHASPSSCRPHRSRASTCGTPADAGRGHRAAGAARPCSPTGPNGCRGAPCGGNAAGPWCSEQPHSGDAAGRYCGDLSCGGRGGGKQHLWLVAAGAGAGAR